MDGDGSQDRHVHPADNALLDHGLGLYGSAPSWGDQQIHHYFRAEDRRLLPHEALTLGIATSVQEFSLRWTLMRSSMLRCLPERGAAVDATVGGRAATSRCFLYDSFHDDD